MTFKISSYNKKEVEKEEKKDAEEGNVKKNDNHGTISTDHAEKKLSEEGMSEDEKRDKRIDERIVELEKIGVKRGFKRKVFSVIGIVFMFITSLVCMYLSYILLSDIIDIVEMADKRIIEISDIEIKKPH
jgi:hypothetical protein